MTALRVMPAVSVAVTVIVLTPVSNGMFAADQLYKLLPLLVTEAVPEPPRSLTQLTRETTKTSVAVPFSFSAAVPLPDCEVMAMVNLLSSPSACAEGLSTAAAASRLPSVEAPPPQPANASAVATSDNAKTT